MAAVPDQSDSQESTAKKRRQSGSLPPPADSEINQVEYGRTLEAQMPPTGQNLNERCHRFRVQHSAVQRGRSCRSY